MTDWVTFTPVLGDVDGDGRVEVIVGVACYVYCLDGRDGSLKWRYRADGQVYSLSAALGDVDGDGRVEVIVGVSPFVYCLDGRNGSLKWRFYTEEIYIDSSPVLGDVNGDDRLDVVIGDGSYVYCLFGENGLFMWKYNTSNWVFSSPAIGDVDGDGSIDIVIANIDGYVYCLSGYGFRAYWRGLGGDFYRSSNLRLIDPDSDGLSTYSEGVIGTDPYRGDTDFDGLSDGYEVFHGTDPLNFWNPFPSPTMGAIIAVSLAIIVVILVIRKYRNRK